MSTAEAVWNPDAAYDDLGSLREPSLKVLCYVCLGVSWIWVAVAGRGVRFDLAEDLRAVWPPLC